MRTTYQKVTVVVYMLHLVLHCEDGQQINGTLLLIFVPTIAAHHHLMQLAPTMMLRITQIAVRTM